MTHEEQELSNLRRERIARVRKILRWMPRRSNIHRYPVLKWFARATRKRIYLWSFRTQCAVPAIWAGTILAFWPLYGIQIPIAVLFALWFRANLPILVSLQLITNPITLIPIYFTSYQVGRIILLLFGFHYESLTLGEIGNLIRSAQDGNWIANISYFSKVWAITALGATVIGTFFASIGAIVYRFTALEMAISYQKLKEIQARRKEETQDRVK